MADLTGMLQASAGVSTGNPNAWDISKAYLDAGSVAFDVTKGIWLSAQQVYILSTDSTPTAVFASPDGYNVYWVGDATNTIYQYELGSKFNVAHIIASKTFSVSSQESSPSGLYISPDGLNAYVVGTATDRVHQYALSTAWDISSASYVNFFLVSSQDNNPTDIRFKPDGTRMYIIGNTNDRVYEYSLSTAWDVTSASFVQSLFISSQESSPKGLHFSEDGLKLWIIGDSSDWIYYFSLSTAWNISTASPVNSLNIQSIENTPQGLFIDPSGSTILVAAQQQTSIYTWAINNSSVTLQDGNPKGLFFSSDGLKMFVVGDSGNDINEYSLSTAWDPSTLTYVRVFSVAGQDTSPYGLFFKDDGLKMFVVGDATNTVYAYDLSIAWDLSTASYLNSFSVNGEDPSPAGIYISPDGINMYITGDGGNEINQYTLGTAWNISTASITRTQSITAQETSPKSISFKPDGTVMYVLGSQADEINQYTLSTPWNISTISFVQLFKVADTLPEGLYFSPDGEKFFITGSSTDCVFKYSISEE